MTAESLWDLFARTGLPEAYSLYHQTLSGSARDFFGQPFREPFVMGWPETHGPTDKTSGT